MKYRILVLFLLVVFTQCQSTDKEAGDKLYIVATTGMIADAVKNIAADHVEVEALMGPGVDPHLYKATQGDLKKLRKADLIFYNGLLLEGKMGDVLGKMGRGKPVFAVAESIDTKLLLASEDYADAYDPHVWFDISLWQKVVFTISEHLMAEDPEHKETYQSNTQQYMNRLGKLHSWTAKMIDSIPAPKRVLITAHDAFRYFGEAYDIEVMGLQGISTLSEYGLQDITNMTQFIADRGIKAVFVESSVPQKALEAVVEGVENKGHKIKIGGTLYSDAMGAEGTPEGTYTGMVRHNVNTIFESLK